MQNLAVEVESRLGTGIKIGVQINGLTLDDASFTILTDDIEIGTFVLDRNSISGSDIAIGEAEVAQLSFTLSNRTHKFDAYRFEGAVMVVDLIIGTYHLAVGKFTVDSPPKKLDTISIVSLDFMAKTNKKYVPSLGQKATIYNVFADAAAKCGITLNIPATFLNSTYMALIPTTETTYHDVIGWAAEIAGANAWVDWNGELRLSWYGENQSVLGEFVPIVLDPDSRYDYLADENDLVISGIIYKPADGTADLLSGTDTYALVISGNPLIDPVDAQTIITSIYGKVGGFTYRPMNITTDGFPHLWPLDLLTISPSTGADFQSVITNHSYVLNGNSTIQAKGATLAQKGWASSGALTTAQKAAVNIISNVAAATKMTAYEEAMMVATAALNSARGFFETKVYDDDGITILEYYQHDQPTLALSLKVTKITAGGVGYSSDGGLTYSTAISATGLSVPQIASRLVCAELITGNRIQSTDGKAYFQLDAPSEIGMDGGENGTLTMSPSAPLSVTRPPVTEDGETEPVVIGGIYNVNGKLVFVTGTLTNQPDDPDCWATVGRTVVDEQIIDGLTIFRKDGGTKYAALGLTTGINHKVALGNETYDILHSETSQTYLADYQGVPLIIRDATGTRLYGGSGILGLDLNTDGIFLTDQNQTARFAANRYGTNIYDASGMPRILVDADGTYFYDHGVVLREQIIASGTEWFSPDGTLRGGIDNGGMYSMSGGKHYV